MMEAWTARIHRQIALMEGFGPSIDKMRAKGMSREQIMSAIQRGRA